MEALIRRHDQLERDLTAIESKLEVLDGEAERLVSEQPAATSRALIEEKQAEIIESWEQLTQRADQRKANLEQSRELQKFLADLRDLVSNTPPLQSCCYCCMLLFTVCSCCGQGACSSGSRLMSSLRVFLKRSGCSNSTRRERY